MNRTASDRPQTLPQWLNPRQALHVTHLINFVAWHGRKVRFDAAAYATMYERFRLERFQVDQSLDAAYALGAVDMYLSGGEVVTVTLLVDDIHDAGGRE